MADAGPDQPRPFPSGLSSDRLGLPPSSLAPAPAAEPADRLGHPPRPRPGAGHGQSQRLRSLRMLRRGTRRLFPSPRQSCGVTSPCLPGHAVSCWDRLTSSGTGRPRRAKPHEGLTPEAMRAHVAYPVSGTPPIRGGVCTSPSESKPATTFALRHPERPEFQTSSLDRPFASLGGGAQPLAHAHQSPGEQWGAGQGKPG